MNGGAYHRFLAQRCSHAFGDVGLHSVAQPGGISVRSNVIGDPGLVGAVRVHHVDVTIVVAAILTGNLLAVGRPDSRFRYCVTGHRRRQLRTSRFNASES